MTAVVTTPESLLVTSLISSALSTSLPPYVAAFSSIAAIVGASSTIKMRWVVNEPR